MKKKNLLKKGPAFLLIAVMAAGLICYVYFGTYDGSPVKYRVLDSKTEVTSFQR